MRCIRTIIIMLTVVALALAGCTIATVDTHKGEAARQEKPTYHTPVQTLLPALVENPVKVIEVSKPVEESQPIEEDDSVLEYDQVEHEILSIIIYQEAGGDNYSDDTRRKVGSVFLNRVYSSQFPNTFEEVATAHRQYGTLYLTGIVWPERASHEAEAHAVQRAKDIAEELLFSGSILPLEVIWQAEFPQGDGIYCQQEDIYFCYSEVNK